MSAPSPGFAIVLRAILAVLAGIFLLDLMGVFIRILSARYPVTELSMLRNLFGLLPSVAMLWLSADWRAKGRVWRVRQWPVVAIRGLSVTMAQMSYYVALMHLEFATASTLVFAGPLFVTILSVPILREQVGIWRWSAVGMGFAGIVLIMRPGSDIFAWWAALPVLAAAGYALSSVLVRRIDREVPVPLVNFWSTATALVASTVIAFTVQEPVRIASFDDLALVVAMGVSGGTGVLFLIWGYRTAAPPVVAPFEYTGILYSFALGWLFFSEAPFERLFPGVLLIVGGGLMIVWRERRRG